MSSMRQLCIFLVSVVSIFCIKPGNAAPPPSSPAATPPSSIQTPLNVPLRTPFFLRRSPTISGIRENESSSFFLIYGPPSSRQILGQAYGGILIQSGVQAYRQLGSLPAGLATGFQATAGSAVPFCPQFNVLLNVTAERPSSGGDNGTAVPDTPLTPPGIIHDGVDGASEAGNDALFALTNERIVNVLSLLGFDFEYTQDLNTLTETSFDVWVTYTNEGSKKIATGSITNLEMPEGQQGKHCP